MTDTRLAVVGMSVRPTCGVHAHATLLAEALEREGFSCSTHWLNRRERSLRGAWGETRDWGRTLEAELRDGDAQAVLFHYSVFSYSFKGLPVFVPSTLSRIRRAERPIVAVMHEFAYPWMYGGWRGLAWAVSQRAALIDVMRTSTAALVTADFRVRWLGSRPWLPRRPVAFAPVFSNLPPPDGAGPPATTSPNAVGLFGYSYQGASVALVLDALALVRGMGIDARLSLLGAPGPSSAAGAAWLSGAEQRGLSEALSFTGTLDAQRLSDALAGCDVLLFADAAGPSGRKGTLAGSLASGAPVLAIDGRRTWRELVEADAARVVAPTPQALAAGIAGLLRDRAGAKQLGARGHAFYERRMAIEHTVDAVKELLARSATLSAR